jgi:hypothetical protein
MGSWARMVWLGAQSVCDRVTRCCKPGCRAVFKCFPYEFFIGGQWECHQPHSRIASGAAYPHCESLKVAMLVQSKAGDTPLLCGWLSRDAAQPS